MSSETTPQSFSSPIAQCIFNYKDEAEQARRNRYLQNRENFEVYHLRQDYSHKKRGQSKEFLAKQAIAVEQLCAFLQQGLMDFGEWFRIDRSPGVDPTKTKILPQTIQHLLNRHLEHNNFDSFFQDELKLGLLGALMIAKVGGDYLTESEFEARPEMTDLGDTRTSLVRKDKKTWRLKLSLVRQEDYFPDPTGDGLYEVQRIEMDWHKLVELAKASPGDFDMAAVMQEQNSGDTDLQDAKKSRETGQNTANSGYRRRVTIYECWGTLLDRHTGKVLMENCVSAIDAQGNVIRPPKKNPFWHGTSPFVVSPIIRVPLSVWHKALMDAPTRHNIAENELYNLILDAAMMEVHGIKQLHANWLENANQVSDGIPPGTTLLVNNSCPPGMKVLERVDTSAVTPEAINILQLVDREFQQAALSNDTRLGSMPQRAVKATEVVASNQSLTGIMNGIAKIIEGQGVAPLLEKAWLTCVQHMNDLNSDEVKDLVGADQARLLQTMPPEELFAQTARGHKYKVFGLSATLNKIQDFRKIQALLQSIGASPQMMQEFLRKYSITKLMAEIIKSLDIDDEKLIADPEELKARAQEQAMQMQMQMMQNTQRGEGSNPQSQIPQASASSLETNPMHGARAMNNIGMTTPG
jgi:hypothetical protein